MNLRRGLLRLWLALSLCWIVVVGLYAWPELSADADLSCVEVSNTNEFVCSSGKTIRHNDPLTLKVGEQRVKVDRQFLQLSPEEQNQTVDKIAKALSGTGTTAIIREYTPYALVPPLVALALGALTAWVLSGFARNGAG
jgi:hypothetical protein